MLRKRQKRRAEICNVEEPGKEAGKVKPALLKGIPAEEILNYAEKNDIDLIMMGTKVFDECRPEGLLISTSAYFL